MTDQKPPPYVPDSHWVRSPLTIRNSQITLLLVSFTWGLSYVMPPKQRVTFSEVFPPDLEKWSGVPMWAVGTAMLFGAAMALGGEHLILRNPRQSQLGWGLSVLSHTWLCGIYFTLAIAAAATSLPQAHWTLPGMVSAASRPVLWAYIGNLHLGFANLPRPAFPKTEKKRRRKRRLKFVVEEDDE